MNVAAFVPWEVTKVNKLIQRSQKVLGETDGNSFEGPHIKRETSDVSLFHHRKEQRLLMGSKENLAKSNNKINIMVQSCVTLPEHKHTAWRG